MVTISRLTKEDICQVVLLEEKFLGETLGEEMLNAELNNSAMCFLSAKEDEKVLGYIGAYVIEDSMEILNRVTNNEIYKMMILDTVANLARGDKISAAFKDQWAFPIPAYEMIVTGERTGQLAEMMARVSTYYQGLHKNTVTRIKALVEPILIIFLTFAVGSILLAVIIPMFNMYTQVQNMGWFDVF